MNTKKIGLNSMTQWFGTKVPHNSLVCAMAARNFYNVGDILQIGRFFSSGDNFVSDSGDCLFVGRTDFHPKKRETGMHITVCICTPYNCRFQMEIKERWGQTRVF